MSIEIKNIEAVLDSKPSVWYTINGVEYIEWLNVGCSCVYVENVDSQAKTLGQFSEDEVDEILDTLQDWVEDNITVCDDCNKGTLRKGCYADDVRTICPYCLSENYVKCAKCDTYVIKGEENLCC